MKGLKLILVILFLFTFMFAFSETRLVYERFSSPSLSNWIQVSGNWKAINGRLVQTDPKENMAMITIPVEQSGIVQYEFNIEYVSGGKDNYAGFGMHICTNNPSRGRSWGNGKSILGWVTWDPKQYGYPGGFIQVYESKGQVDMGLYEKIFPSSNIRKHGDLIPIAKKLLKREYLSYRVPVKVQINTRTGRGKFFDPFNPEKYFYSFNLGAPINPGGYFTFRTNSVSVSIDNVKITKIY